MSESDRPAYHARDGWRFRRLEGGTVMIWREQSPPSGPPILQPVRIPPNEWASIVAHVSAAGEEGRTWRAAIDFHQEPPPSA